MRLKRMRGLHLRTGRGGRCATLAAAARGACRIRHCRYRSTTRPERHTLTVDITVQVRRALEEPALLKRPEPRAAVVRNDHDARRLADRLVRLRIVAITRSPRVSLAQASMNIPGDPPHRRQDRTVRRRPIHRLSGTRSRRNSRLNLLGNLGNRCRRYSMFRLRRREEPDDPGNPHEQTDHDQPQKPPESPRTQERGPRISLGFIPYTTRFRLRS